jgi:hypothetical protein
VEVKYVSIVKPVEVIKLNLGTVAPPLILFPVVQVGAAVNIPDANVHTVGFAAVQVIQFDTLVPATLPDVVVIVAV